jgi:adenine-specific DNA methylase
LSRPRVLIEDWLPAAAIGVECIRERSTGQQPPDKRLHVWWARRPLTVSRAAVLGSLLPADFPRNVFERLLGFGRSGQEIVEVRRLMDMGYEVPGGFGYERAFKRGIRFDDLDLAHEAANTLWKGTVSVIDPMAGGGSIPLEAVRLGFQAIANEYNPVACSVLEATIDYPFRFGEKLGRRARHWAGVWQRRVEDRLAQFYPPHRFAKVHAYIFARTVPTPNAPHPHTPLVPDWHLLKPKSGKCIVAEPIVDQKHNTWSIRIRELGNGAGQLRTPPQAAYSDGKGISLFDRTQLISADYIKAKAQAGEMKSALYAVALKTPQGLEFRPPTDADLKAIAAAESELARLRPGWEKNNIIPTENRVQGDCDRSFVYGLHKWADMFSARQFLCFGVLVEELQRLRKEITGVDGEDLGEAVIHLLGFAIDKFANYNSTLASWHSSHAIMRSVFDRHDFSFKATFAEMAPCNAGSGLNWAMEDSVLGAYEDLCKLKIADQTRPIRISMGSATSLPQIETGSVTAVVVDPPYADNVQYSELADFFYVWLKRTQGHRRPEWFSTYLCDHDEEAVVNLSRHRDRKPAKAGKHDGSTAEARAKAHAFYEKLMTESFREARRVLRDDGVLTVMFTHKKQEAWASLFTSLIQAGFVITATWPVKTESEHSLHQAKKNAAQSTVILVARKRPEQAGVGYFNAPMRAEIRERAQASADRLQKENLNAVDQLVGSFGPAIEVWFVRRICG